MKTDTLTIPRHSDPLARAALLGLVAVVAWLNITQPGPASMSAPAPITILATPALNQQLAVPPSSLQELAPIANQGARSTPYQLPPTPAMQPGVELAASRVLYYRQGPRYATRSPTAVTCSRAL